MDFHVWYTRVWPSFPSPGSALKVQLLIQNCAWSVAWLCLNLCDPMDYSPPGSSVHGVFKSRILEWLPFPPPGNLPGPEIEPESPALAREFLTTKPPGKPMNMSGLSFPSPGDLSNPRIKPMSPASLESAGESLTTETPGKPLIPSHWVLILAYHLFPSNLPIYWHSLCLIILICRMDIMTLPVLKFNGRIKQGDPYSKTQNSASCRVDAETMFTLLTRTCGNLRT